MQKLTVWLRDARRSGIYGMQRFARALRHDIEAVRNSVQEPWSNGQTEGQINRLKTLKRAMYGRALTLTGIDPGMLTEIDAWERLTLSEHTRARVPALPAT